jgi:hypothetical protein
MLTGLSLLVNNLLLVWHFHTPLPATHHNNQDDLKLDAQHTHPVHHLMAEADAKFLALMSGRTTNVESAAEAYRERRGRHPPPGFEAWFAFVQRHDALIVEDNFDQIYRGVNSF